MPPRQCLSPPTYGLQAFEARTIAEYIEAFAALPQVNFFARGEPAEYGVPWLPSIWRADHAFNDCMLSAKFTNRGSTVLP